MTNNTVSIVKMKFSYESGRFAHCSPPTPFLLRQQFTLIEYYVTPTKKKIIVVCFRPRLVFNLKIDALWVNDAVLVFDVLSTFQLNLLQLWLKTKFFTFIIIFFFIRRRSNGRLRFSQIHRWNTESIFPADAQHDAKASPILWCCAECKCWMLN